MSTHPVDNDAVADGEATGNSEGGETIMATHKKRLRRVSFAEMTSVHFFDRDDEDNNETPKEGHSAADEGGKNTPEKEDILSFLQLVDSKSTEEEEDGDEMQENDDVEVESEGEGFSSAQRPFFRPQSSPSSGSAFGSATSNDDDFFGPVDTNFIGRSTLSDTEASDNGHEVTMDSTVFSMHFRSIARSESGADVKTPTAVHLTFEEKTPIQTNAGSSMELTLPKRLLSLSPSPTRKKTVSSNSSDMSLVGDSSSKYDYGKLPPELAALLDKGCNDSGVISEADNNGAIEKSRNLDNVSSDNLTHSMDNANQGEVVVCSSRDKSEGASGALPESQSAEVISSPSKQRGLFQSSPSPLKYMLLTPQDLRGTSLLKEDIGNHVSASSIQKSISKLNLLEASPFSVPLTSRLEKLTTKSPFKILLEREMKISPLKSMDVSSVGVGSPGSPKNLAQISESCAETFMDVSSVGVEQPCSPKDLAQISKSCAETFMDVSTVGVEQTCSPKNLAQISDSCTETSKSQDTLIGEQISLTKDVRAAGDSPLLQVGTKSTGTPGKYLLSPESQRKMTISPEHRNSNNIVQHDEFLNLQSSGLKVSSQKIDNPVTPTMEKVLKPTNKCEVDGSLQGCIGLSVLTDNPSMGEAEAATPSVPSSLRNLREVAYQETAVNLFPQSASKEEFQIVGRKPMAFHYKVDISEPSSQLKTPGKRRNEELDFKDGEYSSGTDGQQRNPKLQKVADHNRQTCRVPDKECFENNVISHGLNSRHWRDIHSNFLEDAGRLIPPSIDKLNFSEIDSIEDTLYSLNKSKTYGMLCNEIFPQRTSNHKDSHSERFGEIRLLLHQIVHGKAKLQLMEAKKKMLQGRLQLLSSGIQEVRMLTTNTLPKLMGGTKADVAGLQNLISIRNRDEAGCDKVIAMKQDLEALNKKKYNLVKAFQSFCKIKEVASCKKSIQLANNHLVVESSRRSIRLGMQKWAVEGLISRDGLRDISLNYFNFVIQSFRFTGSPTSGIDIRSDLDDVNIKKSFPNMDACKAFSFVLLAETTTRKYNGSQSLAQETQVMSSILGNLVDLVQEIQLARIELPNLTKATFHCPLAGKLNLLLCFFCFNHGKKVSLTLDLSCLNRGIYPSEILPSQITVSSAGKSALADPMIDEILRAGKSLKPGYMRALRLCRCISLVVQGSSK